MALRSLFSVLCWVCFWKMEINEQHTSFGSLHLILFIINGLTVEINCPFGTNKVFWFCLVGVCIHSAWASLWVYGYLAISFVLAWEVRQLYRKRAWNASLIFFLSAQFIPNIWRTNVTAYILCLLTVMWLLTALHYCVTGNCNVTKVTRYTQHWW